MKFMDAYEQSKDAVYGYLVYMTRDAALAEDLSQETFLRMFLHMDKFREDASAKTWGLRIAHNVFLSYARKKRPMLLEEQEPAPDLTRNIPEEEAIKREEGILVRDCLMHLNEQERTILLLRDHEGLSYEEIGRIMELSLDTVKIRIYRARQKFKKTYEDMK